MSITLSNAQTEEKTAGEWLTLDDLASYLKISYRTAQRLVSPKAGKDRLLALRVGNVTRVRRTTLETWLKARERAA
jgi:excisionase family DNA binding protein